MAVKLEQGAAVPPRRIELTSASLVIGLRHQQVEAFAQLPHGMNQPRAVRPGAAAPQNKNGAVFNEPPLDRLCWKGRRRVVAGRAKVIAIAVRWPQSPHQLLPLPAPAAARCLHQSRGDCHHADADASVLLEPMLQSRHPGSL